jgi:hypothetical protein
MDSLEYSIDALNAKGLFYNKELTVYVEGKDDILFWNYLFKLGDISAYIEDVGGNKEIDKYIEKILNQEATFIVACDNDHKPFLNTYEIHPQIKTTYGYSIENSMYSLSVINDMVCKLGRINVNVMEFIENWAEQFTVDVFDLLKYDIANHRFNKGVTIFGDNCSRFLNSPTSHLVNKNNVNEYLRAVEHMFSKEEIEEVELLISLSKKNHWLLIKGHFLTKAVVNVVKYLVRRSTGIDTGSISTDMIYSLTINITENWEDKIDIVTVLEELKTLKS